MLELEAMRLVYLVAQFFQLKEPYQLFYLACIGFGFLFLRKGQVKRDSDIEGIKERLSALEATTISTVESLKQHNNRADIQKSIISEQESRHTNYRKDLSDINTRIDKINQSINEIRRDMIGA